VKDVLKKLCITLVLSALAVAAHAADKKWTRLDACRYVPNKNNDGDSFLVNCANEKPFYVRLYFVDTPETDLSFPQRIQDQYDYFGVTMDEVTRGGAKARDYVRSVLASRVFSIHTRHASAQGRAKTIRYYGLVVVENRYLHEILLGEGLARNVGTKVALPTGEKSRDYAAALGVVEERARMQRRGLWATSDPGKRKPPL
jgi:endonuclease YncB( thermonuclease family)